MFFACPFQEEHSSLDNKNYVESIFILYRIKYQKIKIDLTSPLMNSKYKSLKALQPRDFEEIPDTLKFFSCALHCNSTFWDDGNAITQYLTTERHREYWIKSFISYYRYIQTFEVAG